MEIKKYLPELAFSLTYLPLLIFFRYFIISLDNIKTLSEKIIFYIFILLPIIYLIFILRKKTPATYKDNLYLSIKIILSTILFVIPFFIILLIDLSVNWGNVLVWGEFFGEFYSIVVYILLAFIGINLIWGFFNYLKSR